MRGRGKPWLNRKPAGTDIALRAAELAADVSETDRPQERRRLVSAFTKAVTSGARAAGRGTRAVRRRAGVGHRLAGRSGGRDGAAAPGARPGGAAGPVPRQIVRRDRRLAHRGRVPGRGRDGRRGGHCLRAAGAARLPGRDRGRDAGPGRDRAQARRRTARGVRHPGPGEAARADERLRRRVGPSPRACS